MYSFILHILYFATTSAASATKTMFIARTSTYSLQLKGGEKKTGSAGNKPEGGYPSNECTQAAELYLLEKAQNGLR
jgi:hypothetical protein